jgi:hypothetical protein
METNCFALGLLAKELEMTGLKPLVQVFSFWESGSLFSFLAVLGFALSASSLLGKQALYPLSPSPAPESGSL